MQFCQECGTNRSEFASADTGAAVGTGTAGTAGSLNANAAGVCISQDGGGSGSSGSGSGSGSDGACKSKAPMWSPELVVELARQMAEGMQYLHAHNIAHR
jgi:hypothetical protein